MAHQRVDPAVAKQVVRELAVRQYSDGIFEVYDVKTGEGIANSMGLTIRQPWDGVVSLEVELRADASVKRVDRAYYVQD